MKVVPKVIAMLCSYEAERRMTTLLIKKRIILKNGASAGPC